MYKMLRTRKLFLLFTLLSCNLLALPTWAAPDISLGSVSGLPGNVVNVPVTFTNDGSVVSLQFDVQYDSTQLTADTPNAGIDLGAHGLASSEATSGIRRIVITPTLVNSVAASGELATIPFTISTGADNSSKLLSIADVVLSSQEAVSLPLASLAGGLIVDSSNTTQDSDSDGMPDSWEITYGLDPLDASDASLNNDGDEFTNLQEYILGTDPNVLDETIPGNLLLYNTITNKGNKTYQFSWGAVTSATEYRLYRGVSSTGPWDTLRGTTTSLTFDDNVLKDKTQYYYIVKSYNTISGESAASNWVGTDGASGP